MKEFITGEKHLPRSMDKLKPVLAFLKPKLKVFMKYAVVELSPPTPLEIPRIRDGIMQIINGAKTKKWKQTTVKDAWMNTLVSIEVMCWFYVGECIGKRHIVGYDV